jgi:hypothetical protein
MKPQALVILVALLFCAPAIAQPPDEIVGHIQHLTGSASIERGGTSLPGAPGAALYRGDLIRTAKPGAVGIVLTDDTTISLGSGSELSLKDYAFSPRESKFALAIRMIKGTFSYISGQIARLAPNTARLETPDATIAVRGTKLLVQIKD